MENPASWGRAEHVISETYIEWQEARERGAVGGSLAMTIANALRREGIIDEPTNREEE